MSIQEARRAAFGKWFAENYPNGNLERTSEEVLRKMIAEQAWNAVLDSVVVELPERYGNDGFDGICEQSDGYLFYCEGVVEAIEAAGIRVEVKS